jgi:hypothetical protein
MAINQEIPENKVSRVFRFDKRVRYVVFLTADGKLRASFARPGITSLEPDEETSSMFMRASIAKEMGTSMNKHHGRITTAIVVREKVVLITFMLLDGIVLISAEPGFSLGKVEGLGRLIDQLSVN